MNFKASAYFIFALLTSQCTSKRANELGVNKYCDRSRIGYHVMHTVFNNGKKIGECSFDFRSVCQLEGGFTASRENGSEIVTVKTGSQETIFGFRKSGCVRDEGVELFD